MSTSQPNLISDIVSWGEDQGVVLDGVTAKAIPNRGIGLVASRTLKPGDIVLGVPIEVTRNIKNIRAPTAFKRIKTRAAGITDISVHSLLAVDLVLSLRANDAPRTSPRYNPWLEALPSLEDFRKTIPYFFPQELQALLPRPARDIIARQNRIIDHDFAVLTEINWPVGGKSVMTKEQFIHAWFIVNTRTFHYLFPGMDEKKFPWDDQMALVPIADLINHGDDKGCSVGYSEEGYVIVVEKEYYQGEELSFSYGGHGNDALMAEYGFIMIKFGKDRVRALTGNRWDTVDLEEAIHDLAWKYLGRGSAIQAIDGRDLKIDWEGNVSRDVKEALVVLLEKRGPEHRIDKRVIGVLLDEVLVALQRKYQDVVARRARDGDELGEKSQWDIVVRRWEQINMIADKAREKRGFKSVDH